jgi:tetratricopeptide (TPR) repeat protein
MRRAAAILLAVSALALCGDARPARGQDRAAELSPSELHRIRGWVAWRRAVWRVQRDGFQRVVTELERSREAAAGRADVTTLYLLGVSYLRLGRLSEAETVLRDARAQAPDFAGFLLTDAMRLAASTAETAASGRAQAEAALVKYDEYLEKLDGYPKDGSFAAELRFLGHLYRGRTHSRLAGHLDRAVLDLNRAMQISNDNREEPAAEIVSLLAQVHQSLNQVDEAVRLLRDAVARDPAESAHYFNLGIIFAGAQDDSGARPWFEAALARRAGFAEAHLKLAYLDSKLSDPAAMRPHLEAAAAIREASARGGFVSDARTQSDLEAGFGTYWVLVGRARGESGDDVGARAAYAQARSRLREALAKEPGCVKALNLLIQIGSWTGAPESELEDLKRRLQETQEPGERDIDPYRSTFC